MLPVWLGGSQGHIAMNCTIRGTENPVNPPSEAYNICKLISKQEYTRPLVGMSGILLQWLCTLSVLGHYALTLFELGSTHSFPSVPFVIKQGSN